MAFMRVLSKVDEEGKVSIPTNVRRQAGLKVGSQVEIKVSGPEKAQYIVIHKRKERR